MPVDLIPGGRSFDSETFLIMAIVNRTPDSFYDKGASFADADAIQRVTEAVEAGRTSSTSAESRPDRVRRSMPPKKSGAPHHLWRPFAPAFQT